MAETAPRAGVRLAELLAALSLGVDLGFGQPMEHVLRQCLIALAIANRLGLDEQSRAVAYYAAMLTHVACHSDAHEQAKWFGDDIAVKASKFKHGLGLRGALVGMSRLGAGKPPLHRFRMGIEFLLAGHREVEGMISMHAKLAQALAVDLGLQSTVVDAIGAGYEHWNGRGWPGERRGDEVPIASRLVHLAEFIEVAHRVGGTAAAIELARKQRGKQFDPSLVDLLCAEADEILGSLQSTRTWDAVIRQEPTLAILLSEEAFDAALSAIANFVDLKSPYLLGHSRVVAELAEAAASQLGLPASEATMVRRAALLLGFGRLGISNSIWDQPGPLGPGEWERVRMHPYLTERMLQQSPALAPLGAIAAQHRERLDGSGYPRGLSGLSISFHARIIAAADVYQAMREPRPHRAARSTEDAGAELRTEVRLGRLDGSVVDAILGHPAPRRRKGPAGLTSREVEVLQLLARGLSNKEIARKLSISPKTASNHIEHIYAKINATNRASASLFAVNHGLLPELS
jgi:HD-GYP domain-containing protein (c-di-GMP phosphodiesterase class II)